MSNAIEGLEFFDDLLDVCINLDLPNAMQSSVDAAKKELGEMMHAQESPNGVAYAPLSPVTIKAKGHSKALFDTNALYESVVGAGSGHIEVVTGDGWELGTSHEKQGQPVAAIMQHGSGNIPARPFIGATENMADVAAEAAADELMQQIANL